MTIRNPIEWGADSAVAAAYVARSAFAPQNVAGAPPQVRRIALGDLGAVLRKGWIDFAANRTDVLFLCIIYPLAGILVSQLAYNAKLLPLLFPLVSGFALVGPFAAAGLYEMSRRRERGLPVSWEGCLRGGSPRRRSRRSSSSRC